MRRETSIIAFASIPRSIFIPSHIVIICASVCNEGNCKLLRNYRPDRAQQSRTRIRDIIIARENSRTTRRITPVYPNADRTIEIGACAHERAHVAVHFSSGRRSTIVPCSLMRIVLAAPFRSKRCTLRTGVARTVHLMICNNKTPFIRRAALPSAIFNRALSGARDWP